MAFGPVFRHEMIAAGRKRRFMAARVLIGLGMLALLALGYQSVVQRSQWDATTINGGAQLSIAGVAQLTATVYTLFAWSTLVGVLVVTPTVAAGAIAMERERRTIEYLFATDLSNAEIVLDKLVARLLTVGGLVLGTLPVLAIFCLLGGVSLSLLLTHFVMLASTATLTAAIALTVGVWCERARDAVPRAVGAVFLWLIALPLAFLVMMLLGQSPNGWAEPINDYAVVPLVKAMSAIHPILLLMNSADFSGGVLGVDLNRSAIAWMVGMQLLAAAALLGLCVAVVRRVHLRAAGSPGVREKSSVGAPSSRSPYEHRPMLWKEMFAASVKKRRHSKWALRIGVVLLIAAVAGPLVTVLYSALFGTWRTDFDDYMQMATGMVSTCGSMLMLLMGARAAGLVTYERERDTWLSLLTTPLPAGDIVAAKTWGNIYAFRWPLIAVVLMPLAGALLDIQAVLATLGVIAVIAAVGYAVTAIGLAVSLRMENSIKAVGLTVFLLLGIGVFYSAVVTVLIEFSNFRHETLAFVAYSPLVPFLFVVPTVAATESTPDYIIVAYFTGVIFYGLVGFVTNASNRYRFDRLCQRGGGSAPPESPRAIIPSAPTVNAAQ